MKLLQELHIIAVSCEHPPCMKMLHLVANARINEPSLRELTQSLRLRINLAQVSTFWNLKIIAGKEKGCDIHGFSLAEVLQT